MLPHSVWPSRVGHVKEANSDEMARVVTTCDDPAVALGFEGLRSSWMSWKSLGVVRWHFLPQS